MTATLDVYAAHYGLGFDRLVRGMTALTDVWEHLGRSEQGDVLELLLPGLARPADCWEELAEPLEHLARLDGLSAYIELREQGTTGPLDRQAAYDRVRQHIESEIADVIRRYRGATRRPVAVSTDGAA